MRCAAAYLASYITLCAIRPHKEVSVLNYTLKFRRMEMDKTQRELAEEIGTTVQAISDYERGVYTPSHKIMKKISLALNCSVDILFFKNEEE